MVTTTAKYTVLVFSLLVFALSEIFAQATPSSWTTNYRLRRYAQGVNPGADSLNQNWTDIDWAIYARGWQLGNAKVYPIIAGWTGHVRAAAGDTTASGLWNVYGYQYIKDSLLVGAIVFTDSTTSQNLIRFLNYNDTLKAWIQRGISGDRFSLSARVRSLGRSESNIYSGVEAMSKGLDTVLAGVYARADGIVRLTGAGFESGPGTGSPGGTGGAVTSVFGRTGAVVAVTNDYTWAQINKATSSIADITTRSATDLSSGTLADARLSTNVPLKDAANSFSQSITSLIGLTIGNVGVTNGAVSFRNSTNGYVAILQASGITTSNKTIELPNATGTAALTTNSTFGSGSVWNGTAIDTAYTNAISNVVSNNLFLSVATSGKTKFLTVDTSKYATSTGSGFLKYLDWNTFNSKLGVANVGSMAYADSTKYHGSVSINTVGTINSGIWNGTTIDTAYTSAKVKKIIAGTNVTISPTSGLGDVTINATGGGSVFKWNVSGQAQQTDSLRFIQGNGMTLTQSGNTMTIASGNGLFEVDLWGALMPIVATLPDNYWELDANGALMPKI